MGSAPHWRDAKPVCVRFGGHAGCPALLRQGACAIKIDGGASVASHRHGGARVRGEHSCHELAH